MQVTENLLKAIAVTAELTGTDLSENAARVMAEDLSEFPEEKVLKALTKCRRELKGRLMVGDVVARIDDGRPGPEEAWAMIPKNEDGSVVWTNEMAQAYGVACSLINSGDHVQARMAFIEAYKARCSESRDNKIPVNWTPSLGHDPNSREAAIIAAVEKGRLTANHAAKILPYREGSELSNRLFSVNSGSGLQKLSINGLGKKDAA